jgi:signal transduction histidine kinase
VISEPRLAEWKTRAPRLRVTASGLLRARRDRIQQVLFNLVGNAIKFTPGGAVEVSAGARDGWLDLTVADTGIGIDHSRFDEIFESFSQGEGTAAREQGGTGLGLAITKQLVELHGGKISVESEVGAGSKFIFCVPLSATTRAMLTPEQAKQPCSRLT